MKILKKIKPYIINITIILSIFLLALFLNKIYPFGNIDLAKYDAYAQYKPMLYNFITSIKDGTITSFTFLNGLGNPTIFNYLYYLASPLNLVALLFKSPDAMYFSVIIIKLFIGTITSTFYFKRKTNNNFISTICSIGYIFSSWFIAYYFHIMWLDAFIIFPILQYGLEELINNNKQSIYIFSLSYIMISNFYMAFIVCIYIFIYYMYNIIIKKDKYINKIKNFQIIMLSTIITCLLSAFTIYATYSSFLKMGIYITDIKTDISNLTILNTIKSFFYGNFAVNLSYSDKLFPNISLNIIFLISFLYYFINNKITLKEKITTLIAVAFTIFAFYSKYINYIINCFHIPTGYSYRYSFIFTFYILIIFLRNYKTFDNKIDKKVYFINLLLIITLLILYKFDSLQINQLIFSLTFILSYTIFFLFYNNNKIYKILLLLIIITETAFTINISISNDIKIQDYNYQNNTNNEYRHILDNNQSFYDTINTNLYSKTNTLETFSSMQYHKSFELLHYMGCATDDKSTIYSCNNNDLFNMIFNIEGTYNLPKIYSVSNQIDLYNIDTDNFIENQNNLILGMTGEKNVIKPLELKSTNNNPYIYKIPKNDTYIITINPNIKYIKINNEIFTNSLNNIKEEYKTLNVNEDLLRKMSIIFKLKENDEIEIAYHNEPLNLNLLTYIIDYKKLNKIHNILNKNKLNYTTYNDNEISGTIKVDKNQIIFTTIPYDDSWQITVDNQIVKPIIIQDSLLGIEVSEGKHSITLKYNNKFTIPIIISITTFISLISNIIIKRKKNN